MSSGCSNRVRCTSAEELTAFSVKRDGHRAVTVGEVFADVGIACTQRCRAVFHLSAKLVDEGILKLGAVVEESGHETGVERHGNLVRNEKL